MNSINLNQIPENLDAGIITKKEAVNLTCSFICENFPIFGLHKYDEDFREDIFLYFLEKGDHLIDSFNPVKADFFTYIYSNVISVINTKKRSMARATIREQITTSESILSLSEKSISYQNIDYKSFELAQVPYAYKPISVDQLKKIFEPISKNKSDKKFLVYAMKYSFYITHNQIVKICEIYNVSIDDMYKTIEFCKNSIDKRCYRHAVTEHRRNYSYFQYRKCEYELLLLKEDTINEEQKKSLTYLNDKHKKNYISINHKFQEGYLHLTPTNKTIAEILNICERQVIYYLNCIKKNPDKLEPIIDC